jgi:hypothetical protein
MFLSLYNMLHTSAGYTPHPFIRWHYPLPILIRSNRRAFASELGI